MSHATALLAVGLTLNGNPVTSADVSPDDFSTLVGIFTGLQQGSLEPEPRLGQVDPSQRTGRTEPDPPSERRTPKHRQMEPEKAARLIVLLANGVPVKKAAKEIGCTPEAAYMVETGRSWAWLSGFTPYTERDTTTVHHPAYFNRNVDGTLTRQGQAIQERKAQVRCAPEVRKRWTTFVRARGSLG